MSDKAEFRQKDIEAVYGGELVCLVTGLRSCVDKTHLLGRGGKYDRETYSSIFNMGPLIREIHAGPARDTPDFRRFLLNAVRWRVMQAVGRGRYQLSEIDNRFLGIADQYLAKYR